MLAVSFGRNESKTKRHAAFGLKWRTTVVRLGLVATGHSRTPAQTRVITTYFTKDNKGRFHGFMGSELLKPQDSDSVHAVERFSWVVTGRTQGARVAGAIPSTVSVSKFASCLEDEESKMKKIFHFTCVFAVLFISACAGGGSYYNPNDGVKSSDPQLVGSRDMNYDRLIVPGVRIGPVRLDGRVKDAVQHLGRPDRVSRQSYPEWPGALVIYFYNDECIDFNWTDTGLDPKIHSTEVRVTCSKWATSAGIRVGMPISEAISGFSGRYYCVTPTTDGMISVVLKDQGIEFFANNRNAPIRFIRVHASSAESMKWRCKD